MSNYPKVEEGIFDTVKNNTEQFLEIVGQYFPEAIKDGEVDFTALKEEMGEFQEVKGEHYDFTWAGKQAAKKESQADIYGRTLKFKPQDSVNAETTENIYIEGDNLEALKLLKKNYYGKIKMIYIDPPYNTGSDFVYRDDFTMSEEELAELSGDAVNGERLQKNNKDSARYHTNWLNMMYPRLKLARDLLSEDGIIFISIDNNELSNMKRLCDDVFRENNFVTIIHVQMSTVQGQKVRAAKSGNIVKNGEYILVYCKNGRKDIGKKPILDPVKYDNHYNKFIVKNTDGSYCEENLTDVIFREKDLLKELYILGLIPSIDKGISANYLQEYYEYSPSFKKFINTNSPNIVRVHDSIDVDASFKETMCENRVYRYETENRSYLISKNEKGIVTQRIALADKLAKADDFYNTFGPTTIRGDWWAGFYLDMGNVSKEGGVNYDDGKKPVRLIKQLIEFCTSDGDIILDFFSGSATTAHAVMQLTSEGNGARKFIMVQLDEDLDKSLEVASGETKKSILNTNKFLDENNHPHILSEIGKERIRRAAKKIHEDNPDAVFDDGFKVFEVADTNIRWNHIDDRDIYDIDYSKGIKDDIDFMPGVNDIDIVYEIMLKQYGIPLSTPIEKLSDISDRTYTFADAVVVCLDADITDELIEKLAAIEPIPAKYILRDSAFDDDIEFKDVSYRRLSALIANHQTDEEKKSKYNNFTVEFI